MDYDDTEIAATYDRGRDHGPEVLSLWMDVVASHVEGQHIRTILDLGCGTGRFSESLATRFDAEVIGLDPSQKMLDQARGKPLDGKVRFEQGRGESIPVPNGSVDLIFISMVFHHFDDPTLVAHECRRVLRDHGTVFLRAGVREQISFYPYVEFFPESVPILEDCLPTQTFVREAFEAAGFSLFSAEVVTQEIARNYATYADKLSAGADSVLARLTPHEFDNGIKAVRAYAAQSDKAVCEPIDVFVFR